MTSYASFIADGKVTNAKDFLKLCLRGFGVFVHLREEPLSPDIPTKIEIDNYYSNKLKELNEEYKKFSSFAPSQWKEKQEAEIKKDKKYVEEKIIILKKRKNDFEKIKSDIELWNCTEEYKEVKNFALEQIELSMPNFNDVIETLKKSLESFSSLTGEEFASSVIKDIERQIERYKIKEQEEIKKSKERQDFLDGFFAQIETLD